MTESILSHTFPNGLVLVAEPMESLRSAAFSFLLPAGCVHDPVDRSGLGGFTCEMIQRGSGQRDSRQFVLDLDNLGLERGESVNDSHMSLGGATVAENLAESLAIYADMLRRPHLPDDQLEAVRQVMLLELQGVEDEPSQKAMIKLRGLQYPKPWGRPAQGDLAGLQAISADDVRRHFDNYYHPNGTILGVAGRFDWERLKETVDGLLGDWQPRDVALPADSPAGSNRDHVEYDSNQTHIGIAYPSVPYRDEDYFQAWGSVGVLSGGMSARLFTEVRERRGLCYTIYATCHTLRDRGAVLCYAGTSADRAQETLDVTLAELSRLAKGIESNELDRLKARIKSALIMQQESSSARSSSIARDWFHLGTVRTLDEVSRIIDDLSAESINAYLAEHPPGDFSIVTLGPRELQVDEVS